MRILLVEDDPALTEALSGHLAGQGFVVDRAATLADARLLVENAHYGALVLDRGLPDGEGLDLVRQLRQRGLGLPVIVLTARSDVHARIAGLDAGADDYVSKPFAPDELVARLRAVLRRNGAFQGPEIACANLLFDTEHQSLTIDGHHVALTMRETTLLALLLRRAGLVVTRRVAEDQVFASSEILGSNALEVCVHRLRQKLDAAGSEAEILTVRGVGYLIRPRTGS